MPSFTPNNVWASREPESVEVELTLPSGQNCRAKKVTIPGLIEMGILSMADSLTPIMDQHTKKTMKNGPAGPVSQELDTNGMMSDPESLKAIMTLVDKVVPICVVSPSVKLHYEEVTVGKTTITRMIPLEKREPGQVYTDQIDFADKMWLFDWAAGGLKAMVSFREGSIPDVGGVVPRTSTPRKAKRTPRPM